MIQNFGAFFIFLFSGFLLFDAYDSFQSIIQDVGFMFELVMSLWIRIPLLLVLFLLSRYFKNVEILWQKTLGYIGLIAVVANILVSIVAFIWNLFN